MNEENKVDSMVTCEIDMKRCIEKVWKKLDDMEKKLKKDSYICQNKVNKEVVIENIK